MFKHIFLSLFAYLFMSCGDSVKKKEYKSPDEQYGKLFSDVQLLPVFSDSKTFTDCIPKFSPKDILKAYEEERLRKNFNLKAFVHRNFNIPAIPSYTASQTDTTIRAYAQNLWPSLTHASKDDGGSLIHMRKSYVVPGGRFREAHYWDSYFIMTGLKAQKKDTLIENMVLNFAQLIQDYGYVPSGNRSYYVSRSQPPFFSLMIELLADIKKDDQVYIKNTGQLLKEYQYWMASESKEEAIKQAEAKTTNQKAYRKVVLLRDDQILNRYYDELDTPRPEAYKEDIALAKKSGRNKKEVYREIRSGDESGWGFSSRWLKDGQQTGSIHTTEIIPVDLNALLYKLELVLAKAYRTGKQESYAASMENLAEKRKSVFDRYFWNEQKGFYFDYDFIAQKQKEVYSLAAVYPLYFGLATPQQADKVAKNIKEKFLKPGGLVVSLQTSGQSWDNPYGHAPMQWMAIQGLRKYGHNELAAEIKAKWISTNELVYKNTRRLRGRYNVADPALNNEDPDRIGWTNGILLQLFSE